MDVNQWDLKYVFHFIHIFLALNNAFDKNIYLLLIKTKKKVPMVSFLHMCMFTKAIKYLIRKTENVECCVLRQQI